MEPKAVQLASLAVAVIAMGCGSLPGQAKTRMTLIDIPVHHAAGMPEDIKTSWYRAYVLKTNSISPGETIMVEVRGDVGRPGPMSVAKGTTVLEAIKTAGGFTEFALSRKVVVTDAKHQRSLSLHRQSRSFFSRSQVWFGDGAGDFVLESGALIVVFRGV